MRPHHHAAGADHFYIVTGSAFGAHDSALDRAALPTTDAQLAEVTSARAVINLCGPKAREVLARVVEEDVSNAAFPFATTGRSPWARRRCWPIRIGYVGELGWELHVPTEYAGHVYELPVRRAMPHGIADVGYRAIDTLRMEKGYLYWSSDITPDYTPTRPGSASRVA